MSKDLLPMVADIVSAQTSRTSMTREELTEAIGLIYATLRGLSAQGETGGVAQVSPPDKEPAVAIEKSVFPDYIICLEDGKKLKMLKRHLMAACLRHVARTIPRTLEPSGHLSGDRTELF